MPWEMKWPQKKRREQEVQLQKLQITDHPFRKADWDATPRFLLQKLEIIDARLAQVQQTPSIRNHATVEHHTLTSEINLDARKSRSQLRAPSYPTAQFILPIIGGAGIHIDAAILIAESLERHFRTVNAIITGIRASEGYKTGNEDCSCHIVEWLPSAFSPPFEGLGKIDENTWVATNDHYLEWQ